MVISPTPVSPVLHERRDRPAHRRLPGVLRHSGRVRGAAGVRHPERAAADSELEAAVHHRGRPCGRPWGPVPPVPPQPARRHDDFRREGAEDRDRPDEPGEQGGRREGPAKGCVVLQIVTGATRELDLTRLQDHVLGALSDWRVSGHTLSSHLFLLSYFCVF